MGSAIETTSPQEVVCELRVLLDGDNVYGSVKAMPYRNLLKFSLKGNDTVRAVAACKSFRI
ncbi:MAG TPA: hypothetical protein VHP35_04865 [Terriglobia bacterium]|nr:hypothetical protein [Terriglobia bacterium]